MIAVSNTSPLILLDKTGYLWILERLFKKVVIPPAVDKEILKRNRFYLSDEVIKKSLYLTNEE